MATEALGTIRMSTSSTRRTTVDDTVPPPADPTFNLIRLDSVRHIVNVPGERSQPGRRALDEAAMLVSQAE